MYFYSQFQVKNYYFDFISSEFIFVFGNTVIFLEHKKINCFLIENKEKLNNYPFLSNHILLFYYFRYLDVLFHF